jgi:hypothetical protein
MLPIKLYQYMFKRAVQKCLQFVHYLSPLKINSSNNNTKTNNNGDDGNRNNNKAIMGVISAQGDKLLFEMQLTEKTPHASPLFNSVITYKIFHFGLKIRFIAHK